MAVEMETLEIKIEASAGGAATALKDLSSALKDVKKSLSGLSGGEKQVEKVGDGAKKAAEGMSEAKTATEQLKDEQDKAASSGHKFKFSLSEITKATGKVQSGISGIFSGIKNGDVSSIFGGIGNLKSVFDGASASGKGVGETAAEGAKKAADEMKAAGDASQAAGDAAGASAGGWQAVAAVLAMDVAKAAVKVWWAFQKLKFNIVTAPFKWMAEQAKNAVSKVTQLFAALKRIAMYRLLRTAIKEIGEGFSTGLEDAYYFSQVTGGQLSKSLDLIATEFLYLKNSIGAAVAPLINALAPAVEFVVDKFVALVNVVNQFLSALGMSTTWIKAIKYPTTYKDALDDATGSAKELKRTILGIDEINPLNGDNSGGKGSNKWGASDYSQMFEYQTVDSAIGDFASKIREKIETGDWAGVGTLLGQKLNTLISKANSLVDWNNGAGEKITKFLTNITSAFNGFINEFDGTKAGYLVGNAIQTAFNSIGVVFSTTDWTTLAGKITDFIDGAFEKIDGEKIGSTIKLVVSSLLRTFTTALANVDKDQLAEDISGFFKGLDAATIFKDLITAMAAVKETIWPPILEGLKGIGTDILSAIWNDFVISDSTGAPGWSNVVQKLAGIGHLFSGNIISGFALIFGDNLFGKIKEGLESVADKIADNFPGFAEIASAVYLKIADIWNGIISKLKEWAGASPLTSWLVPLLDKAMVDTGKKSSEAYGTGLNKDQGAAGSTFGKNISAKVKEAANGTTDGSGYNSNYTSKMKELTNVGAAATAFGKKVKGNVTAEANGSTDGNNYNTNYTAKMKLLDAIGTAATDFGKKIKGNVTAQANGSTDGGNYNSNYTAKMKLLDAIGTAATAFGQKVKESVTGKANGRSDGYYYNTDYSKQMADTSYVGKQAAAFGAAVTKGVTKVGNSDRGNVDGYSYANTYTEKVKGSATAVGIAAGTLGSAVTNKITKVGNVNRGTSDANSITSNFNSTLDGAKAGGDTFGSAIQSNVKTGINAAGIASNTKTTISNNLTSNTTIGCSFGEKIGENISANIKKGAKKSPPSFNLNLAKFGGGTYTAKMTVAATGGVFDAGQAFIANEAGPELVGNIGRKTAVANTSQMVDAMAQGVYMANAEGNMLLRQMVQYAAEIAAKEYSSGGEVTVESITSAMARNNRRLGKTTVGVY